MTGVEPSLMETLMLAISQSIEGTRSIPATLEMAATSSGDFHAACVKGARLIHALETSTPYIDSIMKAGWHWKTYAGPNPLTMFLLKVEQNW